MPNYRRVFAEVHSYFLTVVTQNRVASLKKGGRINYYSQTGQFIIGFLGMWTNIDSKKLLTSKPHGFSKRLLVWLELAAK